MTRRTTGFLMLFVFVALAWVTHGQTDDPAAGPELTASAGLASVSCPSVPARIRRSLKAQDLAIVSSEVSHRASNALPAEQRGAVTRRIDLRWSAVLENALHEQLFVEFICSPRGSTPDPNRLEVLKDNQLPKHRKRKSGFSYEDPYPKYLGSIGNVAYGVKLVRLRSPRPRNDDPFIYDATDSAVASALDAPPLAGPKAVSPSEWAKSR